MKLAEALSQRADINRRIEQVKSRLQQNAKVQEGESPAEEPVSLFAELDTLIAQLEELMIRINLTNAETLSDGVSLTALLARRDCLTIQVNALRNFLDAASNRISRGMRSEIRILSTVNVREYREKADILARDLRELDAKIQALNWSTELK